MSFFFRKGCFGVIYFFLNIFGIVFGVGMGDVRGFSRAIGMNVNLRVVSVRLRVRSEFGGGLGGV